MPIFRPVAGAAKNDSGTIVMGGNVQGTRFVQKSVIDLAIDNGVSGSEVAPGAFATVAGGNWNKMVSTDFLINGYSTKIAGLTNNALHFADGNKTKRSIYRVRNIRTTFTYNHAVNVATGFDSYGNRKETNTYSKSTNIKVYRDNDTLKGDHAAEPTRAIPGEYTFHVGSANPTSGDYTALTNGLA